jgi:hypothetical protein
METPKFVDSNTYKTLMKVVSVFGLATDLTKCYFVLPKWGTLYWYKIFIHSFEVVEEYAKGSTKVFSTPKRPHITRSD